MVDMSQLEKAGQLLRECRSGSLAVIRPDGGPYVSLVMIAVTEILRPVLLLSDLAEHSKCLAQNNKVSLLLDGSQDGSGQSTLTGARMSLVGTMERVAEAARANIHALYIDRHPDAAGYAGFGDFHYYQMQVDAMHLVSGFGKIDWIQSTDLTVAG